MIEGSVSWLDQHGDGSISGLAFFELLPIETLEDGDILVSQLCNKFVNLDNTTLVQARTFCFLNVVIGFFGAAYWISCVVGWIGHLYLLHLTFDCVITFWINYRLLGVNLLIDLIKSPMWIMLNFFMTVLAFEMEILILLKLLLKVMHLHGVS